MLCKSTYRISVVLKFTQYYLYRRVAAGLCGVGALTCGASSRLAARQGSGEERTVVPPWGALCFKTQEKACQSGQVLVQRHFLILGLAVMCLGRPGLPVGVSAMQIAQDDSSHMHL